MKIEKADKEHLNELSVLAVKYMEYHVEIDNYFEFKENFREIYPDTVSAYWSVPSLLIVDNNT